MRLRLLPAQNIRVRIQRKRAAAQRGLGSQIGTMQQVVETTYRRVTEMTKRQLLIVGSCVGVGGVVFFGVRHNWTSVRSRVSNESAHIVQETLRDQARQR